MGIRARMIRRPARWIGWLATIAMLGAGAGAAMGDDAGSRVGVTGKVVDEAGDPVAGVQVSADYRKPVEPATTGADGTFRLDFPIDRSPRIYTTLVARADDGRLGAKTVLFEVTKPESATITLKPPHPLEVRVVDGDGRSVAGVEVHLLADFPEIASGRTDDEGRWATQVPADLITKWRVYAFKSKVGFDYAQAERARGSAEPPFPLPDRLTLALDGALPPLRIKAVDRENRPLAGIEVGPWLLRKPGRESQMNGMNQAFIKTDEAGVAALDWLPARLEGKISIIANSTDHYLPDHATWIDPSEAAGEVTLTFDPLERLSGRVTTADGKPAEGARVELRGQGAGNNSFSGMATADADGRYELKVYSEQAYILMATKGDLAAPYKTGVVVRAGRPVEGVDLVLGPATRLKGRVTVGPDKKPAPQISVAVATNGGSIPSELKREGDRTYRDVSPWKWARTDADGRYEFILGPGEYRVQGPARVKPVELTIPAADPPAEVTVDLAMPRPDRGPFAITVVDEAGSPVAGAVIDGAYQAQSGPFSRTVADERGTARIERSLDPLVLVAATPDRTRVGIVHIDAEATEARVVVKPAAVASGRLVDPDGKPIAGLDLSYGVRIYLGPDRNSPFSHYFGGKAPTDAEGHFRLPGLLVGESYEIYWYNEATGYLPQAQAKAAPTAPGELALGDVVIDLSSPKPYVPPTPAERTATAFAARKEKSPREKLEYTLDEAKREYTRPLLLFGAVDDPACVELFRLFSESSGGDDADAEKTPGDLRWEFELATLDSGRAEAKALAGDLGVAPGGGDFPCLAVLSGDGKLSATYPLRNGPDGKLDPRPLAAFLLQHKPPTRDAEAMLAEGLARAKAEDKRVFLIMSASWCGPCRMLARFLAANKDELGRHYAFVKLDVSRDAHANELIERYEGKDTSNGVPWYVILDADGKPLITSTSAEGDGEDGPSNIGFPSSKVGIDHFMTMLRQTAPRLSDEGLAALRRKLEEKP